MDDSHPHCILCGSAGKVLAAQTSNGEVRVITCSNEDCQISNQPFLEGIWDATMGTAVSGYAVQFGKEIERLRKEISALTKSIDDVAKEIHKLNLK